MSAAERWVLEYIANSVWQVPLIFAAAWGIARVLRRVGSQAEHRAWVAALMAQVVLPACTVGPVALGQALWRLLTLGFIHAGRGQTITETTRLVRESPHGVLHLPAWLLTAITAAYAGCFLYFTARLVWGLWRTSALRRGAASVDLAGDAAMSWQRCCAVFGVRGAEVAVSAEIGGPLTLGVFRRMLLFPVGWMSQVGPAELEAAMAHECAHMARQDFAKNLLFETLSLPAAWHPVVWMTRARLAESREMVCDALAAKVVDGRQRYARALLRLASMAGRQMSARTLHAIGIFDANHFERRVMRLTEKREAMRGARQAVLAAVCVVAGLGTCASAMALRMTVGVPAPALRQEAAPGVSKVSGGVMAGNILTKVNPVYPQAAKDAKVQGAVRLKAIIGKDGAVRSLQVISGPEELTHSALDAVQQWVYKPYLLNGQPTEVETVITVNYSLAP